MLWFPVSKVADKSSTIRTDDMTLFTNKRPVLVDQTAKGPANDSETGNQKLALRQQIESSYLGERGE